MLSGYLWTYKQRGKIKWAKSDGGKLPICYSTNCVQHFTYIKQQAAFELSLLWQPMPVSLKLLSLHWLEMILNMPKIAFES